MFNHQPTLRVEPKKIKINWQFSIENARNTMNSKYQKVNQENLKYKIT
jgi:hypothetical protein